MPLIEIRMLRGRTPEQKRRLLEALTRATRESLGVELESIRVWIHELDPDEYMVAGEPVSERKRGR